MPWYLAGIGDKVLGELVADIYTIGRFWIPLLCLVGVRSAAASWLVSAVVVSVAECLVDSSHKFFWSSCPCLVGFLLRDPVVEVNAA